MMTSSRCGNKAVTKCGCRSSVSRGRGILPITGTWLISDYRLTQYNYFAAFFRSSQSRLQSFHLVPSLHVGRLGSIKAESYMTDLIIVGPFTPRINFQLWIWHAKAWSYELQQYLFYHFRQGVLKHVACLLYLKQVSNESSWVRWPER